ncbi:unnamed protein product [Euphydryas editha]|uniref:Uncharacterized protein n=1 Tax=Euphydryas editha TaxID=104508 RepID=A0AAU9V7D7_EUPED|nr:unnamed protein product [Euphydryas editha]
MTCQWLRISIIILSLLVTSLFAQTQSGNEPISNNVNGSYKWAYETANEVIPGEREYLQDGGQDIDQKAQIAEDGYSYKAPDGSTTNITYVPDENAFQPRISFIILSLLVTSLYAQPERENAPKPNNVDDSYHWAYETANEVVAREKLFLTEGAKEIGQDAQVAEDGYSYKAKDGSSINITYVPDENAFQPRVSTGLKNDF